MKHKLALLIAASLAACGTEPAPNGNAAMNQLEAGENALWNELSNVAADANASAIAPPALAEPPEPAAPEATGVADAPKAKATAQRQPEASKTAPAPSPPTRDKATPPPAPTPAPTPEPSSVPKAACTPEHAAMGHCQQ